LDVYQALQLKIKSLPLLLCASIDRASICLLQTVDRSIVSRLKLRRQARV